MVSPFHIYFHWFFFSLSIECPNCKRYKNKFNFSIVYLLLFSLVCNWIDHYLSYANIKKMNSSPFFFFLLSFTSQLWPFRPFIWTNVILHQFKIDDLVEHDTGSMESIYKIEGYSKRTLFYHLKFGNYFCREI